MRVSSNSFTDQFVSQVSQLQQKEIALQGQASTGLAISSPSDNPSAMDEVLNYQTQASQNQQYQANITELQAAATTTGTAINTLQTYSSQAETLAEQATSGTTTNYATYASQIGSLIQQALTAANTQDANGNYIFGGTNSSTPPFVATTNASGVVTGVTYQGNTSTAQVQIASGTTVSARVPGANSTGTGATGLITDSRSGADFFNHLIQLQADLTAAAAPGGTTTAITSNDLPNLTKDNNHFIDQVSANSVLQSTLTTNQNLATSQNTNLTTEISNKTSADLATTLTQLQQTETAYQAALESGSKIFQTSLLNYLQ